MWYVVYALYDQEYTNQVSAGIVFIIIMFFTHVSSSFYLWYRYKKPWEKFASIVPITLYNIYNYQVQYYDITWCQSIELDTIPVI